MLRSTRIVTLLGIAVQAVGFFRTVIIAAALGVSLDVDAYNLALIAPTFISTVIGGWLQTSFVGRYAGLVAIDDKPLAAAYRARMLILVLACALVSSALCFLFPERIMTLFMPASQAGMSTSAASALRVTGWILIPVICGDFLGLILNSHGLFFAAALAPLVNALISVVCLWLWPTSDLSALVWTLLLGAIGQMVVIMIGLKKLRLSYPLFRTGLARSEVHTSLMLALPLLPAIMFSNAMSPMVQFQAAQLGEGAVSIYGYASRLHGAVMQILIMGLGTVLLPHFAALWSRNEKREIVVLLRKLARATVLVTACLGLGIYQMGDLAVGVLLRRGAFNQETTHQVALIWAVLSISLFPFTFGTYIAKLGQAMRQVYLVLATSAASFVATLLMTSAGASIQDFVVICLAPSVAVSAATIVWFIWLRSKFPSGMLLRDIANAVGRTAVMLIPPFLIDEKLQQLTTGISELLALLLRGGTFTIAAAALLWGLGWHRWFFANTPKPENPPSCPTVLILSEPTPPKQTAVPAGRRSTPGT